MLEKFLEADIGTFDDITDWMNDEFDGVSSADDFMRDVSGMMDEYARFE